jgi:hypothetical protein
MIGWTFFLVEREDIADATTDDVNVSVHENNGTNDQGRLNKPSGSSMTSKKSEAVSKSDWIRRTLINVFLLIAVPTFVFDTIPFTELTKFIPPHPDNSNGVLHRMESFLLGMEAFRNNVAQPYYYMPYLHPIGLYQGVWSLYTGTGDHNNRIEVIIHYRNDTISSHMSPDWIDMTWYVKKRWQRVMTFYENFMDAACKDCYASYYAEQYGPKNVVRSVRLMLHKQQPPVEPPGNIFDMEFFFKPAREVLVDREPEEIFLLNYCDDAEIGCEHYMKLGYCVRNSTSESDTVLLEMTKKCRKSCQQCDVDADALEIGNRVSVYYVLHQQYYDGTIIDTKMLHTVRQYLIRYDGYEDKPEWKSSIVLRRLGVRLLTDADENGTKVRVEGKLASSSKSSLRNPIENASDYIGDDHIQDESTETVIQSNTAEGSDKDEL